MNNAPRVRRSSITVKIIVICLGITFLTAGLLSTVFIGNARNIIRQQVTTGTVDGIHAPMRTRNSIKQGHRLDVTISIGVAAKTSTRKTLGDITDDATRALANAKSTGRNKIESVG